MTEDGGELSARSKAAESAEHALAGLAVSWLSPLRVVVVAILDATCRSKIISLSANTTRRLNAYGKMVAVRL